MGAGTKSELAQRADALPAQPGVYIFKDGGGRPIVLLADHQTTGGYPIVATVIEADLGRVAQRAAGESLRFYRVERDEALERRRVLARSLSTA